MMFAGTVIATRITALTTQQLIEVSEWRGIIQREILNCICLFANERISNGYH